MDIDEDGDFRICSKNESDHNTILVEIEIPGITKNKEHKKTGWNIRASEEKFGKFREKLARSKQQAYKIMADTSKSMTERYKLWEQLLYKAAITTIGKTTYKNKKHTKTSHHMERLRKERRQLKKEFELEKIPDIKRTKMQDYIKKQHEIREKATEEESERINKRFEKMTEEKNGGFWKERRRMNEDDSSTWLITKGEDGNRIFDPCKNKENIANFYEKLYSKEDLQHHPYHDEVKEGINQLTSDTQESSEEIDQCPTKIEIRDVIRNKKNKKSTTDWKNEILKRGETEMVEFFYPVIKAFWEEEKTPAQWNKGIITNIWKGKGDREKMVNQRGITVSSAYGTTAEELVFKKVTKVIKFTQAQAGGRKGASTADHVFILRNIISLAIKEKRNIIITFYDVKKAYDKADMNDMLYSLSKSNVKGKTWRLTKSLNEELTAQVNTKAGLTREITRETGGKQGGKLMVPLFSKMMDNLSEDMLKREDLGIHIANTRIPGLLYVDDKLSLAEGYEQQEKTLIEVNDFSIKHKLEWGEEKCKTMEIGNHREKKVAWKLGEKEITKCDSYRYLGEEISRDGKNDQNLKERCDKVKNTVRAIITCCKSEIMRKIGMKVILQLHESETIPALLYNAEAWTLNAEEKHSLDKVEFYAWRKMIGLPTTTPTAGLILTVGSLFASIRVEVKQLIYLQKILKKDDENWAKKTLFALREKDLGWAKQIDRTLTKWGLEEDWEVIRQKTMPEWTNIVKTEAEVQNLTRLRKECESKSRGETKQKTKTKHVLSIIDNIAYNREPDIFLMKVNSITHTRALIMGRYGMLKCASNFQMGYGSKMCSTCNEIDTEEHRINYCRKWENINLRNDDKKLSFGDIYSEDYDKCLSVVTVILSMWDLDNGKNDMRTGIA